MGTVGTVHTHVVLHILIGNGIDTELPYKPLQFLCRTCLLHSPDGLCQGVCTTPRCDIDGALVGLISQTDEQFAAWRVVAFASPVIETASKINNKL